MEQEKSAKNRRRSLIVDRKVQVHFLALPVLSVILNTILFSCILWYAVKFLTEDISKAQVTPYIIIMVLSCALLMVNFGLVIYLGLIASNHFVGPLYRLRKSIDELIEGSYGKKITFRESDVQFRLAQVYNELSSALHARVEKDMEFTDQLKEKIRHISSEAPGKITSQLREIELELDSYKKLKSQYLNMQ